MSDDHLSDEAILALLVGASSDVVGEDFQTLLALIDERVEWKRRALAAEKDADESNRQRDEARALLDDARTHLEMAAIHLDDAVHVARLHGGGAVWRKDAELLRVMAERCRKAGG